ncbi:MAG: DUF5106 domain-containing protein [Proteiniphilum sp.]|jgi:hypothetical protein|nr:DUF5106 domain-containing protein [Proteiniphilum sp.]
MNKRNNILQFSISRASLVILAGLLCLAASSCRRTDGRDNSAAAERKPGFNLPSETDMPTDPVARANYLVRRYWNSFDFSDTAYIHIPEVTERAFADFIDLLSVAEYGEAVEAINSHLSAAEKGEKTGRMYEYFLEQYEKYLYDPNSLYRNDAYYIPVMRYVLSDESTDEAERIRPGYRLSMMLKNRVGDRATDFTYTLSSGKTGSLSGIRSDYTILYFNNPGCMACREISAAMKDSPVVNDLLDSGRLTVLAFYPDEDADVWEEHRGEMPENWINGYDRELALRKGELYDLKAIPTLYLLDGGKRVVLKDADFAGLEAWLEESLLFAPEGGGM